MYNAVTFTYYGCLYILACYTGIVVTKHENIIY